MGEFKMCAWCGTFLYVTNYLLKRNKLFYCSRKCLYDHIKEKGKQTKVTCTCKICKKQFLIAKILIGDIKGSGKFCSKKCFYIYKSKYIRGKKHQNYNGSSKLRRFYRTKKWQNLAKSIYKRDNWQCQCCGTKSAKLHCHHIEPYRINKNNLKSNLIALCSSCHAIIEKIERRKYDDMGHVSGLY